MKKEGFSLFFFVTFFDFLRIISITNNKNTMTNISKTTARPLYEIAREISKDWKVVYFGAIPYLSAMRTLENITDNYGMDSGDSIVRYFLANASTWRGETARRIKKELNTMLKSK
jgi:hypothetical protein